VRWRHFMGYRHVRNFVASYRIGKLTGTPVAGSVLTRQKPAHIWGTATYALHDVTNDAADAILRTDLSVSDPAAIPRIPAFNSSRGRRVPVRT
jgi:hypothetical protein